MPAPNLSILVKMSGGSLPPNSRAGDVEVYDNGRLVIFETDNDIVERQIDRQKVVEILQFARQNGFFQLSNVIHDGGNAANVPDVTISIMDSAGSATITSTKYQRLKGEMRKEPFDVVYKKITDVAWESYTNGQAPAQAGQQQAPVAPQAPAPTPQAPTLPFSNAGAQATAAVELPSLDDLLKTSNLDFGDPAAPVPVPAVPQAAPVGGSALPPLNPNTPVMNDQSRGQMLPPLQTNFGLAGVGAGNFSLPPLNQAPNPNNPGNGSGALPSLASMQQSRPPGPAPKAPAAPSQQQPKPPQAPPQQQNQPKPQPPAPPQNQPPKKQDAPVPTQQPPQAKPKPPEKPPELRPEDRQPPKPPVAGPEQPTERKQPPREQEVRPPQAPPKQDPPRVEPQRPPASMPPQHMSQDRPVPPPPAQPPERREPQREERPPVEPARPREAAPRPEPPQRPPHEDRPQRPQEDRPRDVARPPQKHDEKVSNRLGYKKPPVGWDHTQEIIGRLEESLKGKLLTFYVAPGHEVTMDDMRFLYSHLRKSGNKKTLYVMPVVPTSQLPVVWRMATLLREFGQEIVVILPEAASVYTTLLSLSADTILMSPIAYLSPVETQFTHPLLHENGSHGSVSLSEVLQTAQSGMVASPTKSKTTEQPAPVINPLVVTAAQRQFALTQMLCTNLLKLSKKGAKVDTEVQAIVSQLTSTYLSTDYPITVGEVKTLGLPVKETSEEMNDLLWELLKHYTYLTHEVMFMRDGYKSLEQQAVIIESEGRRTLYYKEIHEDQKNERVIDSNNRWRELTQQLSISEHGKENTELQWKELQLTGHND